MRLLQEYHISSISFPELFLLLKNKSSATDITMNLCICILNKKQKSLLQSKIWVKYFQRLIFDLLKN